MVNSVLARPILDEKGKVLLAQGVTLTDWLINRVRRLGVQQVYIQDPRTDDIIVEDAISENTRRFAIQNFENLLAELKAISSGKATVLASREQLGRQFGHVFDKIVSDLQASHQTLVNLASIFTADGYLYHHSVNVAILATVIGLAKGYNQTQIKELGIGALLHDIGMLELSEDLIKKNGEYTPEELEKVKQHTVLGYEFLKTQDGISTLTAHVALQHHERLDGSGYPRGLRGKEIHEYAQIVGMCDVFNALNSQRRHRNAYLPHESMEYLMAGSLKFDYSLVKLFVKNVAVYPLGMTVTLNNGQSAVVVTVNPEYPHRPVVRPLTAWDGTALEHAENLDLTQHLTLMIVKAG